MVLPTPHSQSELPAKIIQKYVIIIKKMIDANMRVVVVERDAQRADHLHLE